MSETILVIDDDKTARRVMSRTLEKLGFKTVECENGREGWEHLWESDDISIVITDMVMPDMDGRELVHLIRNHEDLAKLPVIMVSGCLSAEELQPIMSISPKNTFFMSKPLDGGLLEKHLIALGFLGAGTLPEQLTH